MLLLISISQTAGGLFIALKQRFPELAAGDSSSKDGGWLRGVCAEGGPAAYPPASALRVSTLRGASTHYQKGPAVEGDRCKRGYGTSMGVCCRVLGAGTTFVGRLEHSASARPTDFAYKLQNLA